MLVLNMFIIGLFFLSLLLLYLSQRFLTKHFSFLVHHLGGTKKNIIVLWSLIFLPGTILHELSHFFMAMIVGARTGKVEVLPEFLSAEDDSVALGSVQTQKLNILQGVLVGLAPLLTGLITLFLLSQQIYASYNLGNYSSLALFAFLFFVVANSFFPSKSDLTHAIPAAITLIVLAVLLLLSGVSISFGSNHVLDNLLLPLLNSLWFALALNLFIGLLIFSLRKIIFRW